VTEAEVIEAGTDLEQVPTGSLFGTNNPVEIVKRATEIADALASIIKDKGLYTVISGKAHVQIEAWQALGAMLGVTSICEWTRPVTVTKHIEVDKKQVEKSVTGWEARAVVQTLDGRTIGAAESDVSDQ
jgi:hypothetical protein